MVDIYMRQTGYKRDDWHRSKPNHIQDISHPIVILLGSRSAGKASKMSFSPAGSPHNFAESTTPESAVPVPISHEPDPIHSPKPLKNNPFALLS